LSLVPELSQTPKLFRIPGRRFRAAPVILAAAVAASVTYIGAWIPSYWADEAATVRVAGLPVADLGPFLLHRDAVHGLYYFILHTWGAVFGFSEASLRAPSALAVGVSVAGLIVLGRMLRPGALGWLAAALFLLLPRTGFSGIEARSYAWTAAAAILSTICLVRLLRRRDDGGSARGSIVAYVAVTSIGVWLFVYLGLLVIAHAVTIAARSCARNREVRAVDRVLSAGWRRVADVLREVVPPTLPVFVLCSPILVLAVIQREQIAWLSTLDVVNVWTVLAAPWAESSPVFATVVVVLCAIALVIGVVSQIRRTRGGVFRGVRGQMSEQSVRAARTTQTSADFLSLGWLLIPWLALPTGLLAAGHLVVTPVFTARYLTLATPAAALLLAWLLVWLTGFWLRVAVVIALVVSVAPTFVGQRTPYAKNGGSDLREISQVAARHSSPGDGFYFEVSPVSSALNPRFAYYGYPDAFRGRVDVGLRRAFPATGEIGDDTRDMTEVPDAEVLTLRRIWVVTPGHPTCTEIPAIRDLSDRPAIQITLGARYEAHRTTACEVRIAPG